MLVAAAPPTLAHTRRTARPMVALARQPGPNTPAAQLTSSAARTGPLRMSSGATASVVPDTPTRANAGSQMASTPAITVGKYSGRQPASTALTAIFSTVARPRRGATSPMSSSAARPPASTAARPRAAVEQALGPPLSVRPRTLPATPIAPAEPAHALAYAGLVVTVSSRSSTVRGVEITEPRWTLPRGLNVGTPRAQVEATLGEPQ